MARQYVNVYIMTMCYGGPEEGGWWYDRFVPVSSQGFSSRRKQKRKMYKKFKREIALCDLYNAKLPPYTSVNGGEARFTIIQDEPATYSPKQRPYYE